jgi:hypothetical protein
MAAKPLLTQAMRGKRLAFCKRFRNWTVDDWKKVMFSDESHFELRFANTRHLCSQQPCSDRFDPRFTRKTVKYPAKIMAWGCFSWRGRGGALERLNKGR